MLSPNLLITDNMFNLVMAEEKDVLSEDTQSVSDKVYSTCIPPYYWSSPWPTYPYHPGQNWYTPNTKNPDSIASKQTVTKRDMNHSRAQKKMTLSQL